jgi:uncharacterized repeat protein (TIGR01451 family)
MRSASKSHLAMTRISSMFGALSYALLAALLAAWAPARADAATASARTISNIATLSWGDGKKAAIQLSNEVLIEVETRALSLTAYRVSGHSTGEQPVPTPQCRAGDNQIPISLGQAWEDVVLSSTSAVATNQINAGEPLLFVLDYPDGNRDPSQAESVTGRITAKSGDSELLTVFETGPNTGKFAGYIQTSRAPPAYVAGDCKLTVGAGDTITVESMRNGTQTPFQTAQVEVLVDPFGLAFDSQTAAVISGARITLLDEATGQPATVFGDDGRSAYPSSMLTGETVSDSGGTSYSFPAGEYRFPLVRPGRYRLKVEPPSGYTAPSSRTPAELSHLRRRDGLALTLVPASYGQSIVLDNPAPVRIDIPLDKVTAPIFVHKDASGTSASPGDTIQYRITVRNPDADHATGTVTLKDQAAKGLRLRAETLRLDGQKVAAQIGADGASFSLIIPALNALQTAVVTYAMEVRQDARSGSALNQAEAVDSVGNQSNAADVAIRLERRDVTGRMTIIGRIIEGGCSVDPGKAPGIAGVRVMLEDGSYTVTDSDGRYHFEGVKPGLHVVQLDDTTLPANRAAVDCARNTRSAGRAFSRFVDGQGGALLRVDFRAIEVEPRTDGRAAVPVRPAAATDTLAAGAETDWLQGQEPGIAWLFPGTDHNPRAPIVRVAIKHLPGQSVKLLVDGRPVDPIAFDGTRPSADGGIVVSLWRGVPLETRNTMLTAEVRNADGSVAETLRRPVHYSASPMKAELLRDRSVLVADGVTRPVIAVRLTDRDGKPARHGLTGEFEVPAPYYPAVEADAQQARQLAGLERARPFWRVQGDDGIAYVELEPTTASGTVSLRFDFRDGDAQRDQRLEFWLDAGNRPWTIVGLAAGTLGFNRLMGGIEALDQDDDKVLKDGRVALYAKGKVSGKWLMTLAYDSDKDEDETRFGGIIDPNSYYTVYADRSERRYDAASVRKLYLRLERPQFYALFGDYETGIDEPVLARYVRAFNGVKAEYRSERFAATAFAADTPNRHRRDEIQGNGLSGPYALGARDVLPNSERVTIEVRDRLRSDRIVEQRLLTRHIDYDIDYRAGTLRFREPILSRSSALDPQFIIAEYEVDGVASRSLNAGGRIAWRSGDQKLQVAATALRDANDQNATTLVGADVRYRPNASTEIRAEAAVSDGSSRTAAPSVGTATAWQVEAEHHSARFDVLAYAREQEAGFGVGQVSAAENGTRKFGVDGRARFGEKWSLSGSAWHEQYLASEARRIAGRGLLEYRDRDRSARAGVTFADDRLADRRSAQSTILQLGVSHRFFDNKLELDAQTELPIAGNDESIDFPARHRIGASYAVNSDVTLVGSYEIADGEHVDARTARIGFDLKPWAGARIALSGNMQNISEYGPRSFAAYGLSQSLVLDKHWTIDFSLDGSKTLGGIDPARVLNPLHPVASGGILGNGGGFGGSLAEDFTAVTAGATFRSGDWSVTGRAEYRNGEDGDRYGFTAAALRQIGEGKALGGAFNWFTAESETGAETRTTNLQVSWAHRPADSRFSFLDKVELREDKISGAVAGLPGPIGIPSTISGDARSRRMVNSLAVNFTPKSGSEFSLFWGSRYVSEQYGADDIKGFSNVVGLDLRFDLSDTIDVGVAATARQGIGARTLSYSAGPSIGISPAKNSWLSVGWNVIGFHDRDFEDARYTRSGPYVTMRVKFDQLSLAGLGLGRR